MKILIINPNSDGKMTAAIQETAEKFAQGEFEVATRSTPGAPKFIDTYEDQVNAAPGMIRIVRENEKKFDAFIIACHCDPNLDVIKEVTEKVVVGIGEASMKMASMLGHCFSVISTSSHSVPNKEALVRKYNLEESLASVRAPVEKEENYNNEKVILKTAREAVQQDKAEVIVLGCAGMAGLDKTIQNKLKIPVLDGVVCALIIAAGLVKYNVSTSKANRYNPGF